LRILNIKLNEINTSINHQWNDYLDYISFIWNCTPTRNSNFTPWEIMKGEKPPNLVELRSNLVNEAKNYQLQQLPPTQQTYQNFIENKIKLIKDIQTKVQTDLKHYDKLRFKNFNKKLNQHLLKQFKVDDLVFITNECHTGE